MLRVKSLLLHITSWFFSLGLDQTFDFLADWIAWNGVWSFFLKKSHSTRGSSLNKSFDGDEWKGEKKKRFHVSYCIISKSYIDSLLLSNPNS